MSAVKSKKGFTLVELLVVIAIIAMLMGILMTIR
ncbi:MAG: prepilin-type N-terminal cleavage/methylation domain-containing protein [Anaerohalosphaeraceae bacterium]|nr:prepilin-type N-terminal cleavage/methylation domain-containing protein [Anaerohalosphaeraceae bacterium]